MFAATGSESDMVECPYNKSHRMLRKRLQAHLLKCRHNYPDVELQKCPFNQTHLIPEPEFEHHVTNCSDRKLITQYKYDAPEGTSEIKEEEVGKHKPIVCEENWDDTEVEDYNPQKYAASANIVRQPQGVIPSERKMFIKSERKRLGEYNSEDEEEEIYAKRAPPVIYIKKEDIVVPKSFEDELREFNASRGRGKLSPLRLRSRSRSPQCPPPPKISGRGPPSPPEASHSRRRRSVSPPAKKNQRQPSPDLYDPDEDPYYNGGSDSSSQVSSSSRVNHNTGVYPRSAPPMFYGGHYGRY